MNWKLIFQLSLFGLAMAFATISLIPMRVEPAFWLFIFVLCAWLIAKYAPGNYFAHGFWVSIVNCVWITAAHVVFYRDYSSSHRDMLDMSAKFPIWSGHARRQMIIMGPLFGIACGLILWIVCLPGFQGG